MRTTSMRTAVLIGIFVVAGVALAGISGCRSSKKQEAPQPAAGKPEEQHEAHHGGCLNVIETCDLGHAEVKIEGNVLRLWFVGGENETDKAVRVSDTKIVLAVKTEGGREETLTLNAKPSELAEEKVGDCSHFEGQADWLAGIKKFTASGAVHLKGKERPIRIEYPGGYDPDAAGEKTGEPAK